MSAILCAVPFLVFMLIPGRPRRKLMIENNQEPTGLAWQVGVWNEISGIYLSEIDQRFVPVVESTINSADLTTGETVLDLGTGTGAVAEKVAATVGPSGAVVALDISPEMLALVRQRVSRLGLDNVTVREGRAEEIPADDDTFDVVLASLSMMYVLDREKAAREIARVLKPGGRFVASVWAGPEECDIVLFQQTAGRCAGPPPAPGVGPAALADPSDFLRQLEASGIQARVDTQQLWFDFADFASAWDALAGVTTAHLSADQQQEARNAVMAAVYPNGDGPRRFLNTTQFVIGRFSQ
jgi:SAM-dependent methyltransferase